MRTLNAYLLLLPTLAFTLPSKHLLTGKVVKVTDGDIITVLTADNEQERIRLYGIDAPEQKGVQPYWRASRDQLAQLPCFFLITSRFLSASSQPGLKMSAIS